MKFNGVEFYPYKNPKGTIVTAVLGMERQSLKEHGVDSSVELDFSMLKQKSALESDEK